MFIRDSQFMKLRYICLVLKEAKLQKRGPYFLGNISQNIKAGQRGGGKIKAGQISWDTGKSTLKGEVFCGD
jgi:hypothetical protein